MPAGAQHLYIHRHCGEKGGGIEASDPDRRDV
jgi:hypothetical protein